MKSRTLKRATLRKLGACKEYRDEFRRRFGVSVDVTEALCVSVADVFDWDWAAQCLLSRSALADYKRTRAATLADYKRIHAPAWDDYNRICAAAWARAYINEQERS